MKKGDFTNLANDYAKYRPAYNMDVINDVLRSLSGNTNSIRAVDIGAGTGIFTKCLIDAGVNNITAVEPNADMRTVGRKFLPKNVKLLAGSAESTGLQSQCFDLVTMASSFHWTKTQQALQEFDRILAPGGVFSAVWNPRLTDRSVSENEIQKLLTSKYNLKTRMSSGLSGITKDLRHILNNCGFFRSVVYVDGVDVVQRSHEEYIGAWRSVNDVQTELGKDRFDEFLEDVAEIISKRTSVEVHYLTRAWIAIK